MRYCIIEAIKDNKYEYTFDMPFIYGDNGTMRRWISHCAKDINIFNSKKAARVFLEKKFRCGDYKIVPYNEVAVAIAEQKLREG